MPAGAGFGNAGYGAGGTGVFGGGFGSSASPIGHLSIHFDGNFYNADLMKFFEADVSSDDSFLDWGTFAIHAKKAMTSVKAQSSLRSWDISTVSAHFEKIPDLQRFAAFLAREQVNGFSLSKILDSDKDFFKHCQRKNFDYTWHERVSLIDEIVKLDKQEDKHFLYLLCKKTPMEEFVRSLEENRAKEFSVIFSSYR